MVVDTIYDVGGSSAGLFCLSSGISRSTPGGNVLESVPIGLTAKNFLPSCSTFAIS